MKLGIIIETMKSVILTIVLVLLTSQQIIAAEGPSPAKPNQVRSRKDILGPVKQLQVKPHTNSSIEYRSVKKAFFLSLALPGAGQFYVGGKTKNYVKAALFATVEGALIGGWYYYAINRYSKKSSQAKRYALQNFSVFKYDSLTFNRYNALDQQNQQNQFAMNYLSGGRTNYCAAVYGNEARSSNNCNDFEGPNFNTHLEHVKYNTLEHQNDMYGVIESPAFVLGWSDAQQTEQQVFDGAALGTSAQQNNYIDLREQAREYEDMRTYFFVGVFVNHLFSAVDAMLSAQANNKMLYDGEMVWYRHLKFFSTTQVSGKEITTDVTVALRF